MEFVPGLSELRKIMSDWQHFTEASFAKQTDNADGVGITAQKPEMSVEEAKKLYPAAAAYLLAEEWSQSPNMCKSSLGREAMDKMIHGTHYAAYVRKMQQDWEKEVARVHSELKKFKTY